MLLREDKMRLCGEQTPSEAQNARDYNYLGEDDFSTTNYKPRRASEVSIFLVNLVMKVVGKYK